MCGQRFVRLSVGMLMLTALFVGERASAWEFSLEGSLTWENLMLSQLGTNGFFGNYNADNSSTGGNFASANGWLGGKLNDLTSGSNAARQPMATDFIPEIKINPAVKLRGQVPNRSVRQSHLLFLSELHGSRGERGYLGWSVDHVDRPARDPAG